METQATLMLRAAAPAVGPDGRLLPFMLQLVAWIALPIGTLAIIIGVFGGDRDTASEVIAGAVTLFSGLLLLALAGILRWVQLIEWRLGLRMDSGTASRPISHTTAT